jgi:hypothetical protein
MIGENKMEKVFREYLEKEITEWQRLRERNIDKDYCLGAIVALKSALRTYNDLVYHEFLHKVLGYDSEKLSGLPRNEKGQIVFTLEDLKKGQK